MYLLAKCCVVHCDVEFSHLEIYALRALNGCIGGYDVDDKCCDTNYRRSDQGHLCVATSALVPLKSTNDVKDNW